MAAAMALSSCNDGFLDRQPKNQLSEEFGFNSYETCTAYLQSLYEMFTGGYTSFQGPTMVNGGLGTSTRDTYSGILTNFGTGLNNVYNGYANRNSDNIPTSNATYSNPYIWLRRANVLIEHIGDMEGTDEQRTYIEAVARFFRAYCHYSLLINFGDAVYVDHVLTDSEEEMQVPRDSRLYVADQIYRELDWCMKNIPDDVSDDNTIKSYVVKAFMSRFTLFEGTWRKYHNVDESQCASNGWMTGRELLEACASVSRELINGPFGTLYTGDTSGGDTYPGRGYGQLWTSEDLAGVPGVMLYAKYIENYKMHRIGHFEHIGSASLEMPQSTVDLYLTKDGLPIHNKGVRYYDYVNGEYKEGEPYDYANCDVYKTFRNRDPRMWQTVMPPYHVNSSGNNDYTIDESDGGRWSEYIHQFPARGVPNASGGYTIRAINGSYALGFAHKALPSGNWGGNVLYNVPQVSQTNKSANAAMRAGAVGLYSDKPFQRGRSGYFVWKHHAAWDRQDQNNPMEIADKPLFKIEETMLNYAEAMWELGRFDQSVADASINKLRDRAEVGRMDVAAIGGDFDPDRDPSVDPVLWEIRRERLIELMGEGFSWEDIRRWKKGDWYVNKQHYGVWVDDAVNSLGIGQGGLVAGLATGILNPDTHREYSTAELAAAGNCGHLYYYQDAITAGLGWLDKFYLLPIPSDEILLNPNLEQQELWK